MLKNFLQLKYFPNVRWMSSSYSQGQEPEPKVREYFYYIDHQGMLFLDDARMKNFTSCFKEKKFLKFFFSQLRMNNTGRYEDFPYLSICGKERNFVRCDDYPIVYTHIIEKESLGKVDIHLAHNYADQFLSQAFLPNMLVMFPDTGRVYHPAPSKVGGIGLVRSKLAIEFSKGFTFAHGEENPPTNFNFGERSYELDNSWYVKIVKDGRRVLS